MFTDRDGLRHKLFRRTVVGAAKGLVARFLGWTQFQTSMNTGSSPKNIGDASIDNTAVSANILAVEGNSDIVDENSTPIFNYDSESTLVVTAHSAQSSSDNQSALDKLLQSTKAKNLASATSVPEVLSSTSISDILRMMEKDANSCVLVRDISARGTSTRTRDAIFRRSDLFHTDMTLKCTAQSLSYLIQHLSPIVQLDGEASVSEVLQEMQATGFEEVGVADKRYGVVQGVISIKDILVFLRRQEQECLALY